MNSLGAKILLACVIGVIAGAITGYISGSYGFPGWVNGAIAGLAAPIVFFVLRSRADK